MKKLFMMFLTTLLLCLLLVGCGQQMVEAGGYPGSICWDGEIYICLDQLTDAPDEADAVGKVTSTVKLGDQPTKDGQSSVADKRSPIVPMEGGLAAKVDGAWYFFRLYDAEKDGPLC